MVDNVEGAFLSKEIYKDLQVGAKLGTNDRYQVTATPPPNSTGYYGAIVKDSMTNEVILVNRGTEPSDWYDLKSDMQIAFNNNNDQFNSAMSFVQDYNANGGEPITATTGHSLGGYISQLVGVANNYDVQTIGSPGAGDALIMLSTRNNGEFAAQVAYYDYKGKMTNITRNFDWVGRFGDRVPEANNLLLNPTGQVIENIPNYLMTEMGIDATAELFGSLQTIDNSTSFKIYQKLTEALQAHSAEEYLSLLQEGEHLSEYTYKDGYIDEVLEIFYMLHQLNPLTPAPIQENILKIIHQIATAQDQASPLVFDLDGDGIEALTVNNGVYWDIDNDDFAEASGWAAPDDGLLAYDWNEDGAISNHSELFGTLDTDGFTVLQDLDSDQNGFIDTTDSDFSNLLIWQDSNSDGISQPAELQSLTDLNITSISLGFTNVDYQVEGHNVTHESTFTMNRTSHQIADVWFQYDAANTQYIGDVTLDIRTMFLPTVRGYGNLPDLHVAMSMDNELLEMVKGVASKDLNALVDSDYDFGNAIREILFKWAGADTISADARGTYINGQELAFLEALSGQDFTQRGAPNPRSVAGGILENAFDDYYSHFLSRLVVQSSSSDIFSELGNYNPLTDNLQGSFALDHEKFELVMQNVTFEDRTDALSTWEPLIRVIENTIGLDNIQELPRLETLIQKTNSDISLIEIRDNITDPGAKRITGSHGDDVIIGGAKRNNIVSRDGNDEVYGEEGNDIIAGGEGHDKLFGQEGNDILYGNSGHDTLDGGVGDDLLEGGEGSDTYKYIEGLDTIVETGGIDKIVMDAQYSADQVTIGDTIYNDNDLQIYIDSALSIVIEGYYNSPEQKIEAIHFSNGDVIQLTDIDGSRIGTDNDDAMVADPDAFYLADYFQSLSGNDLLNGGLGNDILDGGPGNDKYIVEHGQDVIYDNSGTDTIIFGSTDVQSNFSYDYNNGLNIYFNSELRVSIPHQLEANDQAIEFLKFGDGTTLSTSTLPILLRGTHRGDRLSSARNQDRPYELVGGPGDDNMQAGSGDDVLEGGPGDDYANGDDGNDTYIWAQGDGNDLLDDPAGSKDVLILGEGITPDDVRFTVERDDLQITIGDETVTINDQYEATRDGQYPNQIETLAFDNGEKIDITQPIPLTGTEGNDSFYGTPGDDIIKALSGDDQVNSSSGNDTIKAGNGDDRINSSSGNDTIKAGPGDDTMQAGSGNDVLEGGPGDDYANGDDGNDTYIWAQGDGNDLLDDPAGSKDVLILGEGITPDDVRFTVERDDLQITIGDETVTINDQYEATRDGQYPNQIETLAFDNGEEMDITKALPLNGTTENDNLRGTSNDDAINGYDGDDRINSSSGNDTIKAGPGDDTMQAGSGDDVLEGGPGDDYANGDDGNDTYIWAQGDGNDLLDDPAGSKDVLILGEGITPDDVRFTVERDDLQITIGDETVTINDQYEATRDGQYPNQIETLAFDNGEEMDISDIQAIPREKGELLLDNSDTHMDYAVVTPNPHSHNIISNVATRGLEESFTIAAAATLSLIKTKISRQTHYDLSGSKKPRPPIT